MILTYHLFSFYFILCIDFILMLIININIDVLLMLIINIIIDVIVSLSINIYYIRVHL